MSRSRRWEICRLSQAPGTTRYEFARQVLIACSLGTLVVVLLQGARWALYGANHRDEYLFLSVCLLASSVVATCILRRSIETGLHFYAWAGGLVVAMMVLTDPAGLRVEFPVMMNLPIVGMFVMGVVCPGNGSLLFAVAYAVFVAFIGMQFDQIDSAGSLIFGIVLVWPVSRRTAMILARLAYLESEMCELLRWRDNLRKVDEAITARGRG